MSVSYSVAAYLDACDKFDVTAVHLAAEMGHLSCLQLLLDAGAKCNIPTKYSKHGSYTGTLRADNDSPIATAYPEPYDIVIISG